MKAPNSHQLKVITLPQLCSNLPSKGLEKLQWPRVAKRKFKQAKHLSSFT